MPVHLHMGILEYPFSFMNQEQLQSLLEKRLTSLRMYKDGSVKGKTVP